MEIYNHTRWLQKKKGKNHQNYQGMPVSEIMWLPNFGDHVSAEISTPMTSEHNL